NRQDHTPAFRHSRLGSSPRGFLHNPFATRSLDEWVSCQPDHHWQQVFDHCARTVVNFANCNTNSLPISTISAHSLLFELFVCRCPFHIPTFSDQYLQLSRAV